MKITEVRIYAKLLPLAGSYNMSASTVSDPETTVVELITDTPHVGWGECCPTGPLPQPAHAGSIRADLSLLAPSLIGLDPTLTGSVRRAMDATMDGGVRAKAAVDIACWDLLGKAMDRRVCDLLGGACSDPVPTYHVIPIGTADESASAAESLQEAGHTKLQLKAGGRHIDEEIESIRGVVPVVRPGVDLFVDVNRGWTVGETIAVSRACADLQLAIEQPCVTYDECANAKPHLRHPLLLDESATDLAVIARAISSGVANGFGMKLTRIGGISAMLAVRDLCRATRTPTSFDDSWGGDIIASACVQIGSTMEPGLSRGAWISDPYQVAHYDNENGPRIENGRIAIPPGPGLGITIPEGCFGDPIEAIG